MRLINTASRQLKDFIGRNIPRYAILSHTWGEDEISLADYARPESRDFAGHLKIDSACKVAAADGFEYIWIDTCCIDKSSSAELSEAINSMYTWYEQAQVCYVHLADVCIQLLERHDMKTFAESKWFTRGWTLQELLAPSLVVFFDTDWIELGSRDDFEEEIAVATGIADCTKRSILQKASVATKFSWASNRETTRLEDMAYCLMGLFDVNMPLLYGEGSKAFLRLQQEIIKVCSDQSVFAWCNPDLDESGIFASSPSDFRGVPVAAPFMTNGSMSMQVVARPIETENRIAGDSETWEVPLACMRGTIDTHLMHPIMLYINERENETAVRRNLRNLHYVDKDEEWQSREPRIFYITAQLPIIETDRIHLAPFLTNRFTIKLAPSLRYKLFFEMGTNSANARLVKGDTITVSPAARDKPVVISFRTAMRGGVTVTLSFEWWNETPDRVTCSSKICGDEPKPSTSNSSSERRQATKFSQNFSRNFREKIGMRNVLTERWEGGFIWIVLKKLSVQKQTLDACFERNNYVIDMDIKTYDRSSILRNMQDELSDFSFESPCFVEMTDSDRLILNQSWESVKPSKQEETRASSRTETSRIALNRCSE